LKKEKYLEEYVKDIADILWLSRYTGFSSSKTDDKEEEQPIGEGEIILPKPEEKNIKIKQIEQTKDRKKTPEIEVHTPQNEIKSKSKLKRSAKAFQAPKKLALPHYREWEKAFKFINFKTNSNRKYEFDEEKTVEYIANTKIFDLKFKKVQEKKYSLTIIIDQYKTMQIWSELIKLFTQMVHTFGVFNQISIYYWDTNSKVAKLYYDKALKQKTDDKSVIIDNNQNLVWILSDCLAPSWKSADSFKKIEKWSKYSLTSIIQMFPKRMWMGTMLYKGKHTRLSSKNFSSLNHQLISNSIISEDRDSLKIPIVSFDAFALQAWAKVVINREKNSISGVIFDDLDFEEIQTPKSSEISIEKRMDRFSQQTSPTAQKLAFYMSVLPVDFQVVRILQENELPSSNQSHVAELFLGGLIERIEKDGGIKYEFYPKVRKELNQNISADESIEILRKMSDFLSTNLGIGFDIKALISDPSGVFKGDIALSDESIAYAKLVSEVLHRAGGLYADIAQEIKESVKEIENQKVLQLLQKKIIKKLEETEICEHVGFEVSIGGTPKDGDYISGTVSQCGDIPENIEILSIKQTTEQNFKVQTKFDLPSYIEIHDYPHYSLSEEKEFDLDIECTLDIILDNQEIVDMKIYDINIDTIDSSELDYLGQDDIEEQIISIIPKSKRFQMGSNDGDDEKPVHEVIINYDFEIAQYPVTVGEFKTFIKDTNYKTEAEKGDGAYVWDGKNWNKKKDAYWDNPYFEQTNEHPVVCISWNDAKEYIEWLNKKTKEEYRLPTEAEWEYIVRAGTTTKWSFGDDEKELEKYAWYDEKGAKRTKPVGEKLQNSWGLYDIHGNVWEWCEDWYVDNYEETPVDGSANESGEQKYKVLRGGSWINYAFNTRSSIRDWNDPSDRNYIFGFRLLRTLPS